MFKTVSRGLVTEAIRVYRHAPFTRALPSNGARNFTAVKESEPPPFDASLLELLVCPLSKKPLKYDPKTNELINEELGIAYPIVNGIPNMIPQEARLLQKDPSTP